MLEEKQVKRQTLLDVEASEMSDEEQVSKLITK